MRSKSCHCNGTPCLPLDPLRRSRYLRGRYFWNLRTEESLIRGADADSLAELRQTYAASGLPGFLQKQVEIDVSSWKGWHVGAFRIAALYARLGQEEIAVDWIRRVFEARSGCMVWTKLYPWFTTLQDRPAFQEMTRRVGVPE